MLEKGPVWRNGEGVVSGDGIEGIVPSRLVAPAATAATPALYLRKSLLETPFLVVEVPPCLVSVDKCLFLLKLGSQSGLGVNF